MVDDYLVDHEPPIGFQTAFSPNGIHFAQGAQVESIDLDSGEVLSVELEDGLDFDVESFNRHRHAGHLQSSVSPPRKIVRALRTDGCRIAEAAEWRRGGNQA